jgi:hypothetical protein
MLHDAAKIAVGAVVEVDLDEAEVADCMDLLKEDADAVGVADVHLIMEDVEVAVLARTDFVEEASMVVGGGCSMPPYFYFSLCEIFEETEKCPDAGIP